MSLLMKHNFAALRVYWNTSKHPIKIPEVCKIMEQIRQEIESLFPETGTSYVILSNRNDWDRKEMSDKLEDILHHHRLI